MEISSESNNCVHRVLTERGEVHRTRLAYGGRNLYIDIDSGTPTASMLIVTSLTNSFTSTPGAKFMTIDIKYCCLNTLLDLPEFLRMKLTNFPDNVI